MLEQLTQLVQQFGQQSVVQNNAVPNENNEAVMQEAQSSIFNGLKDSLAGGNLQQLTDMFSQGDAGSNPLVNNISGNFIENITRKFGIDKQAAGNIASGLIPQVLGSLFGKGGQGGSGFQISDLLGSLTGGGQQQGSGGGIMDTLGKVGASLGLDKDKDGDVDLSDITGMFKK